jgi:hypothetical protein
MLRRLALAFTLLLPPVALHALQCSAERQLESATAIGNDATRVVAHAPALQWALLQDGDSAPELRIPANGGEAPTKHGDSAAPARRTAFLVTHVWARSGRELHRDALALCFREQLAYDATPPPLG